MPGKTLPLEKAERKSQWCWKASALLSQGNVNHAMRMWTCRTVTEDFAERAGAGQFNNVSSKSFERPFGGIIDTSRGEMRNHYQFTPVRYINHFVAYCIGDEDRLLELLHPEAGYITYLGAHGPRGLGTICDGGFSIVRDEEAATGWKKRVMPWQEPGTELIQAAHQPPYWDHANLTDSFVDPSLFC